MISPQKTPILLEIGCEPMYTPVVLSSEIPSMKLLNKEQVDWRLILFVLLLVLLPFILFADSAAKSPLPEGATDPAFNIESTPDTLKEAFPALYSSLKISLATIPTDTVYVIIHPGDQLNVAGGFGLNDTLRFTPYPMALSQQEVKVKPWNDLILEGWHLGTLTFEIVTDAVEYAGLAIPDISYTIEDNELPPGIVQSVEMDTTLTEGLSGIDLLFSMATIPTDTVFLIIDPDDQLRITGIPGEPVTVEYLPNATSLSFDGASIRAVDDAIYEGDHFGTVSFTIITDDPVYSAFTIDPMTWSIIDNDEVPSLILDFPPDTTLEEGLLGVDMLIRLSSIPTDTVFITFDPDAQLRVTGIADVPVTVIYPPTAAALAFDGVSLRAYDDYIFEGDHFGTIQISIESNDPYYDAMSLPDMTFPIIDNDNPPGLTYSIPDVLELSEAGGELPIVVALQSVPTDTVKILVDPSLQLRITDPGVGVYMIFPPNASALNDHILNIKAVDDADFEGTHTGSFSFNFETIDPDYALMDIPTQTVTIFDNDLEPGIIFLDTFGLAGVEGDTSLDILIKLNSIPLNPVTIELTPDVQLDLGKGPGGLVKYKFRSDSALIFQTVRIKIVDDHLIEGDHKGYVSVNITTEDPYYMIMSVPTFDVNITDNDIVPVYNYNPLVFNAFPSVAGDLINIQSPENGKIDVIDANGKYMFGIENGIGSTSIDTHSWPSGNYMVIWRSEENAYYARFIVLH